MLKLNFSDLTDYQMFKVNATIRLQVTLLFFKMRDNIEIV